MFHKHFTQQPRAYTRTVHKRDHADFLSQAKPMTPSRRRQRKRYAKRHPQSVQTMKPTQQTRVRLYSQSYLLTLLRILSKPQVMAFIFLLLIGGAYAAEASTNTASQAKEPSGKTDAKPRTISKNRIYYDVCTNSTLETHNKPNISLAVNQAGEIIPRSCMTAGNKDNQNTILCAKEAVTLMKHIPKTRQVQSIRDTVNLHQEEWKKRCKRKWEKILESAHFTPEEETLVRQLWLRLVMLGERTQSAIYMQNQKGGYCGEHLDVALHTLLQKGYRYNLNMKIQMVHLGKSTLKTSSKSTDLLDLRDHAFLLLDSDVTEVIIDGDQAAVARELSKIQKGKICDTWNRGYFQDYVTNENGFYTDKAGWDTLYIIDYSTDFSLLAKLPTAVKKIFCEQLAVLGYDVSKKRACQSFFSEKAVLKQVRESMEAEPNAASSSILS